VVLTSGLQAVADADGSPWQPRRASRGAGTFELTASQLLSAVINVVQNKWDWRELDSELLSWDQFATARARRPSETRDRNRQAPPRFFEEVYELIIEANRYRASLATRKFLEDRKTGMDDEETPNN
jgi:hypothetical protein